MNSRSNFAGIERQQEKENFVNPLMYVTHLKTKLATMTPLQHSESKEEITLCQSQQKPQRVTFQHNKD